MTAGPKYAFPMICIQVFPLFLFEQVICSLFLETLFNLQVHVAVRRYEYRWADGVQIKKPIEVSAPKYVEYLMDWIESQLDNESIFPQRIGILIFTVCFHEYIIGLAALKPSPRSC